MTYRIGQKVVCINDNWQFDLASGRELVRDPSSVLPVLNGIYTIRQITERCFVFYEPMKYANYDEVAFDKSSFRPLVTRRTDISAFKRLLVPGTKIMERA